jgi:hypothetical protein
MTAAGEILNLPVAIPMRPVVPAYSLPQRRPTTQFTQPHRVYRLSDRQQPGTFCYGADGYTAKVPDKGDLIDLFI